MKSPAIANTTAAYGIGIFASHVTGIRSFLAFCAPSRRTCQNLDVHLIVDNYSTHKHARVKAWLAARPRWHIHFTPTYSCWLNQVERFFGLTNTLFCSASST